MRFPGLVTDADPKPAEMSGPTQKKSKKNTIRQISFPSQKPIDISLRQPVHWLKITPLIRCLTPSMNDSYLQKSQQEIAAKSQGGCEPGRCELECLPSIVR